MSRERLLLITTKTIIMAKLNADENEFDEKLLLTKLKIDFSKQSAEVCDLNLEELYRLSIKFYKEKEGTKAIQMSYKEKIKLLAYTKQVTQGPYRQDAEIGFLDIVGNDRKQAWRSLGDMSKESAMFEFIKYLSELCPLFTPYIKAHLAKLEEEQCQKSLESHQNHIDVANSCNKVNHSNGYADCGEDNDDEKSDDNREENEESNNRSSRGDSPFNGNDESVQIDEETKLLDVEKDTNTAEESEELCPQQDCEEETRLLDAEEVKKQQEDEQRMSLEKQIRATLMASMGLHFRQIAQQQFPDNATEQDRLVDQLLEQQFQQFMQQLYGNQNQKFQPVLNSSSAAKPNDASSKELAVANENGQTANEVLDPNDLPLMESANTWTRKNVKEFKESLKDDPESVIKIGSGELVTVRVPTHDDGSCLFWEFATDGYDIGFGVYFEWYVASNEPEEDEEAEDEDEDAASQHHQPDGETDANGLEASATDPVAAPENEPPTEEIISCYRRDCHEEIHCGSHIYPGRGTYLLKFDNSYSLWRGKTVYYRVYYTR